MFILVEIEVYKHFWSPLFYDL